VSYSVGEIARLAGISVRMLHHYDEIGLLSPAGRSAAGYRRYDDEDLRRLQRILFYRELGFARDDITDLLNDPAAEPARHLRRQHRLLTARLERTRRLVERSRWHWRQKRWASRSRPRNDSRSSGTTTRRSAPTDWLTIKAESEQITRAFAAAQASGAAPDSATAMDVAERHREFISRWFYDCSPQVHRGLGDMYVADGRFAATYESVSAGLAAYIRDAIGANADRAGH
jgi:MerR family transcriptional regulator, thiopeptide resistance regulator